MPVWPARGKIRYLLFLFLACRGEQEGKADAFVCSFLAQPSCMRQICAKPISLHSWDRLCASCTLFICNICRDRHSKQSICTIFRDRYIFFYILELCYQGPYCWSQNQAGGTDMTWHGIILVSKYVWYQMLWVVELKSVVDHWSTRVARRKRTWKR